MAKVTCRFCKKKIDKDIAYCVHHGKQNWYYCNENHANAKHPRDEMYEQLEIIFGEKITSSVLYKEFDSIGKAHSYEKILAYIKENYQYLCMVMSKDFVSTYAKIRYLAAIFKNSLNDFMIPEEDVKKETKIEMINEKYKKRKRRRTLSEIEGDIIE